MSLIACYSNEFILYTSVGRVFTLLWTASSGFKNISESSLTISVSRVGKTQKTIKFWWSPEFHPCLSPFHSYLYSYYNSSRTLCIICLDSAFRTEFQHFILRLNKISFLYGYDQMVRGWKEDQRLGEDGFFGGPKRRWRQFFGWKTRIKESLVPVTSKTSKIHKWALWILHF